MSASKGHHKRKAPAARKIGGWPGGSAPRQRTDEQYRLLFELSPIPMWIFDEATLRFLAVNNAAVKLYGWSRAEFLRMTVKDIRPPEEVPKLAEKLNRQRGSRVAFVGVWRHWKKDHMVFDVEVTISCLRFEGRDARLTMVNDITERKRVEEALRQSEERTSLALRAAQAASWTWDFKTNQTTWSAEYYALYGLKPKVTPGSHNWLRCIDPDDRKMVEETVNRTLKQHQKEFSFEFRIRHPVRGERWIANKGRVAYGPKGEPVGATGINLDITERKRAEIELEQLNTTLEQRVAERTAALMDAVECLHAIMDTALVGILTLDPRGVIASLNPAAVQIFGYAPDDIVGKNISRLMASPSQRPDEQFLAHCLEGSRKDFVGERLEVLGRRKDGQGIMLELALAEIVQDQRQQFVAMVRDITDRKRLERELLDISERERQRLAHDLHDGLGQHLHALFYMATLLARELKEASPKGAQEAGRLVRQLEHALELTRGLARGLQPVNAVPEGLMIALRELAQRTADLYGVNCRFQCHEPVLIRRHNAANHLYRIAQEAVINAMKHGKPTRVRIQLAATRERVLLGVRDNGVGIRAKKGPGHGMGLHIMKYRANAISGTLVVQRQSRGGTEVVCTVARQALLPQEANFT